MANNHDDITRMQNQIANLQAMIDAAPNPNAPHVQAWMQQIENLLSRIQLSEEGI